MAFRVVVMAGGTGGHVFPALAVAEEMQRQGIEVLWLGHHGGLESQVVPAAGIPIRWIRVAGLRGKGFWRWLTAPITLGRALIEAWEVLQQERPSAVLGMGGFVTGPGGIVARLLGIPLVIHEQNAIPGMTNRWLAHIASRVLEAFPGSFPVTRHPRLTGNPVRTEIAALPAPEVRFADRRGSKRLLVLGGSQGAAALNQGVPQALVQIAPELRPEVWHQAGRGKVEATQAAYTDLGLQARVVEFIVDMAESYTWADLVVCRAGALTLAELAATGLGSVLIPYPYAVDDHQTRNAERFVTRGAAVLLPQSELTPGRLAVEIGGLLREKSRLMDMAIAARSLAHPQAAVEVAEVCRELMA